MAKRYNKKNDTLLTVIVAILVAIVLGVGILIIGYVSRNDEGKWFANSDLASWHWADTKPDSNNNGGNGNGGDNVNDKTESNVIISEEISNSGVNVYSAVLPRSAYAANGISENADTAIKLTATIKPETAVNQEVDWSIAWKNSSSSFASGKTVTNYITVTPETDGSLSANLICYQPFGEKIIVTCTSRENPTAKATCTLDYSQKIESVVLKFGDITANLGSTTEIKYEINPNGEGAGGETQVIINKSNVYTIEDTFDYSVKINYDGLSDSHFALKGSKITGLPGGNTDITSDGLYFDYAHDVSNWLIVGRVNDISFSKLSTAEIIEYFSNITVNTLFNVAIEVSGNHSSYTAQSLFSCVGYTNTASVESVEFDQPSIVF